MAKRLNSDLLLFLRQKKLCTSTFTVQVSVWEKKRRKKKKRNRHTPKVCVAGVDKCFGL